MTTEAAQRHTVTTAVPAGGEDAALDRRRDNWQVAQQTATTADQQLADLDARLEANTAQHDEQETALQAAMDRQAELKTALKASVTERDRLRTARKHADRDAATAHQRAQAAEAKYDKALLADMLRQQKNTDLSAHTGGAQTPTPRPTTRPSDTATPRRRSAPTSRQPRATTETPPATRATARRTAASVTARKAHS